jgi:hypothetical protein
MNCGTKKYQTAAAAKPPNSKPSGVATFHHRRAACSTAPTVIAGAPVAVA